MRSARISRYSLRPGARDDAHPAEDCTASSITRCAIRCEQFRHGPRANTWRRCRVSSGRKRERAAHGERHVGSLACDLESAAFGPKAFGFFPEMIHRERGAQTRASGADGGTKDVERAERTPMPFPWITETASAFTGNFECRVLQRMRAITSDPLRDLDSGCSLNQQSDERILGHLRERQKTV